MALRSNAKLKKFWMKVFSSMGGGGIFRQQFEYEEELYLQLDGSVTAYVNASIPALVEKGLLTPATAAPLLRSARGELMSIRGELRALLYVGVLAVVGGVSLLVKENLERIGHVAPQTVLPPLTGDSWGYRRKGRFSVRHIMQKAEKIKSAAAPRA